MPPSSDPVNAELAEQVAVLVGVDLVGCAWRGRAASLSPRERSTWR